MEVGPIPNWQIRDKLLLALDQEEEFTIREKCFGEGVRTTRIASFTERITSSDGDHREYTDEEIETITKKLLAKLRPKIGKVAEVISDFEWE